MIEIEYPRLPHIWNETKSVEQTAHRLGISLDLAWLLIVMMLRSQQ